MLVQYQLGSSVDFKFKRPEGCRSFCLARISVTRELGSFHYCPRKRLTTLPTKRLTLVKSWVMVKTYAVPRPRHVPKFAWWIYAKE